MLSLAPNLSFGMNVAGRIIFKVSSLAVPSVLGYILFGHDRRFDAKSKNHRSLAVPPNHVEVIAKIITVSR